jgi:glycine betaine/choline ABC-type transport system substrate-binding protein
MAVLLVLLVQAVPACVGKNLLIGVAGSPQELIYAELIAQIVTERTGTTVKIIPYRDVRELYAAIRKKEVGVLIENTERGLQQFPGQRGEGARGAYDLLKREYRKGLDLVWLDPVPADGGRRYYAPVITADVMGNLPALPKLINRLTGALTEESFAQLLRGFKTEEKPRRPVRDFLKTKRLI